MTSIEVTSKRKVSQNDANKLAAPLTGYYTEVELLGPTAMLDWRLQGGGHLVFDEYFP